MITASFLIANTTSSIPDDVISDKVAMLWNKQLNEFFVQGRHLCISVFILTQHVTGVGPMIRGNCDLAILQPIFDKDARETIARLFGNMHKDLFFQLMDDVVYDKNLEGSTPQEPKKEVRTMFINAYENSQNPLMRFKWYMAEDPGPFRLLAPEYWKEEDYDFGESGGSGHSVDIVDELDAVAALSNFRF